MSNKGEWASNMTSYKIAIMSSKLRIDPWEGIRAAAALHVEGVHISAAGPFLPDALNMADRRKLRSFVRDLGLEISAISGWGGQVDLGDASRHNINLADGYKYAELASELETSIWQCHVGVMPNSRNNPHWAAFVDGLGQVGQHCLHLGVKVAIETGPEPPTILKQIIDEVNNPTIRVNYDPANLILWPAILARQNGVVYDKTKAMASYAPVDGVNVLAPYIVHTHAKDAIVKDDGTPLEMPLGEGWVDWPRYLRLLASNNFDGYLAIEREVGDRPLDDVRKAVTFLRTVNW